MVPEPKGIVSNKTVDLLARQGLTPFIGSEPACSISDRALRETSRDWRFKKHLEH
jgi:hypothetical protein